jgi:hypothetical protein
MCRQGPPSSGSGFGSAKQQGRLLTPGRLVRGALPLLLTSAEVEQVTAGPEPEHLAPPPSAVPLSVVEHVTPLAECGEVAGAVVAWIVVEMRAGQDHACDQKTRGRGDAGEIGLSPLEGLRWRQLAHPVAIAITPGASLCVPLRAVA